MSAVDVNDLMGLLPKSTVMASVMAFHKGDDELKRVVVALMSKAGHRGAVTPAMWLLLVN
jgi:hypothetical protein